MTPDSPNAEILTRFHRARAAGDAATMGATSAAPRAMGRMAGSAAEG